MVVCDERVGKTSLINRILGNKHNPNQKSTQGIDIRKRRLANDSGIFHWLSVIKANGGNSPIIIVVNKRDLNTGYTFDLNRYKDEFNIVDVLYLSADNDEELGATVKQKIHYTIDDLTGCIEQHVTALEDIKFPLPPSWAKVKDELELMSTSEKDYIESETTKLFALSMG